MQCNENHTSFIFVSVQESAPKYVSGLKNRFLSCLERKSRTAMKLVQQMITEFQSWKDPGENLSPNKGFT